MTELILQVDPATLSTAQQKGVDFFRRRVYTKAAVRKSHNILITAMRYEAIRQNLLHYEGPATAWRIKVEYIYRPATLHKKDLNTPKITRPDLDNLTKSVLDALTETRLAFADDSQIAEIEMSKRYVSAPDHPPCIRLAFGPILKGTPQ